MISWAWRISWRWRRFRNFLRCAAGIHRLKAWQYNARAWNDGVAIPMNPRARPGLGDYRKCEWCGAEWKGAYDGLEPHWRRA